jgi:4-amino-4-deoxy-L-arabinose transferase-like glycosyltransferase
MMARVGINFWLVLIITLFIMFFNLGSIPLMDPDEPVYAETPKEMLQFNEFLSPRIYGEYWYDKPPMYYWLVAASYQLFGVNEFAARFPSAILAVVCVLVVYCSGRRLFGEKAGVAGAMVLATSVEYFYLGKAAVTDTTLNICLTVSLLAFIEKRYYIFYLFAGLATLTKGPIGLLFPGGIVFFYLAFTRNFSELRNMKIPTGILLYSLVAIPWYYIMYTLHGSEFLETFLGFHNITRFTSPEHPEGVLWYYYLPVLMLGFFPWIAIMVQSIWASLTTSRRDFNVLLFLNIWVVFIFLFFTISRTKLVSYILPLYPPLAMIVGWYIGRLWDSRKQLVSYNWIIMLGILTLLLGGGMIWGVKDMPVLLNGVIASTAIFGMMALMAGYFLWQQRIGRAFWMQIGAMVLFSVILMTLLFPKVAGDFASRDIARDFSAQYDGKSPVYVLKFLHPGFTFYTNVYGTELKSDIELNNAIETSERSYFVIRQCEYERLAINDRPEFTVLANSADKVLLLKNNNGGK